MADNITITLRAKTAEGVDAHDPQLTVDVLERSAVQHTMAHAVVRNFQGSAQVTVPEPSDFPTWWVYATFSRYATLSGRTFQPRGEPAPSFDLPLVRVPDTWAPRFQALHALPPPRFGPLQTVIAVSRDVDLKHGPAVGDLALSYDGLADPAQLLAKMALLNLFAVLSDEVDPTPAGRSAPWFSYVRKIVRLDQERFLAEVDPAMLESVQGILAGLTGDYAGKGWSTEPALDLELHIPNLPSRLYGAPGGVEANIREMVTVKKRYEQGDLQLTMTHLNVNGRSIHVLDCDMDESLNLIAHGFDMLRHAFHGGTHPVFMHEYIAKASAESSPSGVATVDLGYELV